ncbi:MFS transporter [Millisia brevis]|uniref:MFS transporter n=1 Tax=Millisia brevis TaxID=264148 RepID=UPI00082FE218|nr:MFS transporter [Millisia brevis]
MSNLTTSRRAEPMRLIALAILSAFGFVTMLTEIVPAGLLSGMAAGLQASPSTTGQLLTVYAAASMLAAVPVTALTRHLPRKLLLILTVAGIVVANTVTALSDVYALTVAARIVAGVCAGVQWALVAGYAMRITADATKKGKALSIAMAGIPLALAVGLPLGTYLGTLVGWRGVYAALAVVGAVAACAGLRRLPSLDAEATAQSRQRAAEGGRSPVITALLRPGIVVIVLCAFAFQAGHMNLYTYMEPFLQYSGLDGNITAVFLVMGVSATVGLWITGMVIDRHIRTLGYSVAVCFLIAAAALGIWSTNSVIVILAICCWGLALGAAPTLFQAAAARAAGDRIDMVQAILVTLFNAGMATGSAVGGVVLAVTHASALPWVSMAFFLAITCALVVHHRVALPAMVDGSRST